MSESDQGGQNPALDELYNLKYDVISDMYRQVAHAQMVAFYERYYADGGSHNLLHDTLMYYCYKVFGSDLIGSTAFALDPYWQVSKIGNAYFDKVREVLFGNHAVTVVKTNRTRKFPIILSAVQVYNWWKTSITQNYLYWNGSAWAVSATSVSNFSGQNTSTQRFADSVNAGFVKDTTWKSRNPNDKVTSKRIRKRQLEGQGEFEMFDIRPQPVEFILGGRSLDQRTDNEQAVGNNLWLLYWTVRNQGGWVASPTKCRVNSGDVPLILAQEQARATALMQDNVDKLFSRTIPSRRYTNLFYNVADLKDAAQMCRSTIRTWRELQVLMGGKAAFIRYLTDPSSWTPKNIRPLVQQLAECGVHVRLDRLINDAYLNFKFGWQSTYNSLISTLKSPVSAADDVNRLIKRNGTFSNLSSSMKFTEDAPAPSASYMPYFDYLAVDPNDPVAVRATRDVTLRCVTNVGVRFPDSQTPGFRWSLFFEKMGAYPTPGDIYDLIPWTWMIDWFAGLGDYIHLMDAINGDNSLINYGFLSYESVVRVVTTQGYTMSEAIQRRCIPPDTVSTPWHEEDLLIKGKITAVYDVVYRRRQSLDNLTTVKSYSGKNLSDYQKSVLLALTSKFT